MMRNIEVSLELADANGQWDTCPRQIAGAITRWFETPSSRWFYIRSMLENKSGMGMCRHAVNSRRADVIRITNWRRCAPALRDSADVPAAWRIRSTAGIRAQWAWPRSRNLARRAPHRFSGARRSRCAASAAPDRPVGVPPRRYEDRLLSMHFDRCVPAGWRCVRRLGRWQPWRGDARDARCENLPVEGD